MSEVKRNASEESEDSEDIFRSTFSSSSSAGGSAGGKVKIGGGDGQVGLASAKLKGEERKQGLNAIESLLCVGLAVTSTIPVLYQYWYSTSVKKKC